MKPSQQPSEPDATLPITKPRSPSSASVQKVQSRWHATSNYLKTDISLNHADIPIIACCLVSGLCDSSAYNAWTCFVSMQTGNTIFLALGASNQPSDHPYGWVKSLTSITCFLLGCLVFASTRLIQPKARGTLAISFLLQSICIIIAAALVQAHVVPEPHGVQLLTGDVDFLELLPLGFLAFQSGGQIVTSRLLGFNEVPTTVLTSVYCDLASDPNFLKKDNVKRNRRLGAVLMILLGGIAGGWISRSKAGLSVTLWIAAAIKFGIACSWSLWRPK
ncbi:hypothetical protein D0Z07_1791 [Hyphodiscus hymeniophilus]|uniref:DUF1275 domain protein n=1 Tax=Hyphodiscus hymeniophilus TaxID=353542 RepID=A0A9P7AZR6_9HELO|nr:hypothetical protein D0Z07_1791 [Hyphodiscus hymeniophilus]